MADYHFTTVWEFHFPLELVWHTIRDMENWPTWWPYVKDVKTLKKGDQEDVGAIKRMTWKTALPYQFVFETELISITPLYRMEGKALGDLEGKGIWTFSSEANSTTKVRYDWIVRTNKTWMNLLAPIAKPLFAYNHQVVMKAGQKGLDQYLNELS